MAIDILSTDHFHLQTEPGSTITQRDGVYCWLVACPDPIKIMVFQVLAEDWQIGRGKSEADMNQFSQGKPLTPIQPNMLSVVSGGVKPGETHRAALARELWQEVELAVLPQALWADSSLPVTQTIQDRKARGQVLITGYGLRYQASEREVDELALNARRSGRRTIVDTPEHFLALPETELRPFFASLLRLLTTSASSQIQ